MRRFENYFRQSAFFVLGDLLAIYSASFLVYLVLKSYIHVNIVFPYHSSLLYALFSLAALGFFNAYKINWRFTSIRELLFIVLGLTAAMVMTSLTLILAGLFSAQFFYTQLLVYLISILFVGAFRISKRILNEILDRKSVV